LFYHSGTGDGAKMLIIPSKHPYNASLKAMALCGLFFGICAVFYWQQGLTNDRGMIINGIITFDTFQSTVFYWVLFACSAGFVLIAMLAAARRIKIPREIEFDEKGINLPYGLMQMKTTRVLYSDIMDLTETKIYSQLYLTLTTPSGKYNISRSLLPDKETYNDIQAFLIELISNQR
jgi:hypothetical protein